MTLTRAFTIFELILTLFILLILVGIGFPYFHFQKEDANFLRLRADFASIQSALAYHKNTNFKPLDLRVLDEARAGVQGESLFYCTSAQISACKAGECCAVSLLSSPIYASLKGWMKTGKNSYRFALSSKSFIDFSFEPSSQKFDCLNSKLCKELL